MGVQEQVRSTTDSGTAVKSIAGPPRDSANATLKCAHTASHDQSSGAILSTLTAPLVRARDLIFGEKIAHGMFISFGTGSAQIHIKDTELRPILESIRTYSASITDCIEKYQGLSGVTPSKAGFRVFSLVLRKLMADDPKSSAQLKSVCHEALTIDLAAPADPRWRRDLPVPVSGVPTKISLSITPLSLFARAIVQAIKTDVPTEDQQNRYAYCLTMEPEKFSESTTLRQLKGLCRQAVTIAGLTSPMVLAEYAMSRGALFANIPILSSNPLIQRWVLELAHLSALAAVATTSYLAYQAYNSARLLRREK